MAVENGKVRGHTGQLGKPVLSNAVESLKKV